MPFILASQGWQNLKKKSDIFNPLKQLFSSEISSENKTLKIIKDL